MGPRGKTATKKKAASRLTKPSPLKDGHNVDSFSCGRCQMDEWLQERAKRANESGTARTFVVCRGTKRVVGYYSLAAGAVERDDAAGELKRNSPDPIPVIVLARLAVDEAEQKRGIGRALLSDAMKRTAQASNHIGARAMLVHALDGTAAQYYERLGFRRMKHGIETLYLPIKDILNNL